ncbi:hypothetical protein [Nocardia sp. NPDC051832]|uniref:hypothetical protein n=1 Tax=Nocardia sp. NPDC051832 TaxID=3155673 RepID=UPI003429095C
MLVFAAVGVVPATLILTADREPAVVVAPMATAAPISECVMFCQNGQGGQASPKPQAGCVMFCNDKQAPRAETPEQKCWLLCSNNGHKPKSVAGEGDR